MLRGVYQESLINYSCMKKAILSLLLFVCCMTQAQTQGRFMSLTMPCRHLHGRKGLTVRIERTVFTSFDSRFMTVHLKASKPHALTFSVSLNSVLSLHAGQELPASVVPGHQRGCEIPDGLCHERQSRSYVIYHLSFRQSRAWSRGQAHIRDGCLHDG